MTNSSQPTKPSIDLKNSAPSRHPLDQLSAVEIDSACSTTKEYLSKNLQLGQVKVTYVSLIEPKKADVLHHMRLHTDLYPLSTAQPSSPLARECEVFAIEIRTGSCYLIEVDLSSTPFVSREPVRLPPGTHSCIPQEEVDEAERIAKTDERVQRLCRQVGIEKDQIFGDGWALGFDSRFGNHRRLQQCLMYARLVEHGNLYAHPLDFIVIVDTLSGKVIHIDFPPHRLPGPELSSGTTAPPQPTVGETDEQFGDKDIQEALERSGRDRIPPPMTQFNYLPELLEQKVVGKESDHHKRWTMREDLKPLHIVQPDGVSFTLNGNQLRWQKWQMHIGFNYREGLIINTVTYDDDDGSTRPIFYRMSLAEMVVPYGAPESPHHRKFAFDVGEYGIGNLTNPLTLGCDCLGAIRYLDAVNVTLEGKPFIIKNAICIHEEDAGILWKHSDFRPGGKVHSVRSRKLVVSTICTVANYEYLFYWNFFQDGTITFDIKLSGILNVYLLAEGEKTDGFGVEVAPRILAQHHAHTFCLRIDPMIDGFGNSVVQTDIEPVPQPTGSPENYLGNGFRVLRKVLKRTNEGAQDYDHSKGRFWSIVNPNKLHYASKEPIGYRIVCRDQPPMLAKSDSMVATRAPFAKHDLFVTPYVPHQYYPSGKFVPGTMETPADSIGKWLEVDKSIENEDIVVYVTFGVNHVPSPEQFPVMSAEVVSITLKPSGFFKQNPSLDVAQQEDRQSKLANGVIEVKQKSPHKCSDHLAEPSRNIPNNNSDINNLGSK